MNLTSLGAWMRSAICVVLFVGLASGCATGRSPGAAPEAPASVIVPSGRAIEAAEVRALQRRHGAAIRRCHEAASAGARRVSLEVTLDLAADGSVQRARVTGHDSAALISCIVANLRGWRFMPLGGEGAQVAFPLQFAPAPAVSRPGRAVTSAEIDALQRQHLEPVMGCLAQAVERRVAQGECEVSVTLLVSPSGEVEGAEVAGGWDAAFRRCLQRQLRGWRLAPLGGAGPAQVRFPMQFQGPGVARRASEGR